MTRAIGHRPVVFGAALAACILTPAMAQAPHSATDWTGLYQIAGFGGGDLPGYTALNRDLDPVITARLQPWARAKMDATNTEAEDTGAICQLAGIFRHPTTVAGFMLIDKGDEVYLISDDTEEVGVRRIYMTDHHPENLFPSWDGHSIGRWEGDTLVVDTIGFNDRSWLASNMEPHSEELHVVERIRAVAQGSALEVTTTVDDRLALTAPYSYSRYYRKADHEYGESGAHAGTGVCNGEPGEPQRWNGKREAAIAWQIAHRTPANPDGGTKP